VQFETCGAFEARDHRKQRTVLMMGPTEILKSDVVFTSKHFDKRDHKPRFAYARLSRQQYHPPPRRFLPIASDA
jgi:hypothetical protein